MSGRGGGAGASYGSSAAATTTTTTTLAYENRRVGGATLPSGAATTTTTTTGGGNASRGGGIVSTTATASANGHVFGTIQALAAIQARVASTRLARGLAAEEIAGNLVSRLAVVSLVTSVNDGRTGGAGANPVLDKGESLENLGKKLAKNGLVFVLLMLVMRDNMVHNSVQAEPGDLGGALTMMMRITTAKQFQVERNRLMAAGGNEAQLRDLTRQHEHLVDVICALEPSLGASCSQLYASEGRIKRVFERVANEANLVISKEAWGNSTGLWFNTGGKFAELEGKPLFLNPHQPSNGLSTGILLPRDDDGDALNKTLSRSFFAPANPSLGSRVTLGNNTYKLNWGEGPLLIRHAVSVVTLLAAAAVHALLCEARGSIAPNASEALNLLISNVETVATSLLEHRPVPTTTFFRDVFGYMCTPLSHMYATLLLRENGMLLMEGAGANSVDGTYPNGRKYDKSLGQSHEARRNYLFFNVLRLNRAFVQTDMKEIWVINEHDEDVDEAVMRQRFLQLPGKASRVLKRSSAGGNDDATGEGESAAAAAWGAGVL